MSDEIKTLDVGLVMPIAHIDNCPPEHWIDVKNIIEEALCSIPGYKCNVKIVSEGDSSGLIHKRIVQGLYNSHVVICDVSCKNPNVMFELGMRLAFDKPTIIIKDDQTTYTFDPGGIEHINYPRDLRFNKITEFQSSLAIKVQATYEDSLRDPDHSPFLKSFGQFSVATIDQTTAPMEKLTMELFEELRTEMVSIRRVLKNVTQYENRITNSRGMVSGGAYKNISLAVAKKLAENNELTINGLVESVYSSLQESKASGSELSKKMIRDIVFELLDGLNARKEL